MTTYHLLHLAGNRLAGQWWAEDWATAAQVLATLAPAPNETVHVYALAAPVTLLEVTAAASVGDDTRATALLTAWQLERDTNGEAR